MKRLKIICQGLLIQLLLWVPIEVYLLNNPEVDRGGIYAVLILVSTSIVIITSIILMLSVNPEPEESRPIDFEESNHNWTRPSEMSDEECGPLPAFIDDEQSISCWKLSLRARIQLLFSGCVWLGILAGGHQPPVWLAVRRPFKKTETENKDTEDGKKEEE